MYNEKIVISKTPLRVSFIGGGTDMPYFYNKYSGATISCAIDKYIYVTVKFQTNLTHKYRLNYSVTENTNSIKKIKNLRIKSALKFFKIRKPIYINTFSDLPANSGLGSSSSFTVGLVNALARLVNKKISKHQLAEIAYKIEKKITKDSLGKQDHYISVFGGLKLIKYKKNNINIKNLNVKKKTFLEKLFLVWTGTSRQSASVLIDQKKNRIKNTRNLLNLNNMTREFYTCLENLDISKMGALLNKAWEIKKKFSKFITNKKIDKLYKSITNSGVYGAKLLGAGNGGFILVLGNNFQLKKLKIRKMILNFSISKKGSIIINN
jgi:D-glycero-alpha-D-manno-heptose-7-phosphate kinase